MTTGTLREVTLHIPFIDNKGDDKRPGARLVLDSLAYNHGGVTWFEAKGMWYDRKEMRRYEDNVFVARVAVPSELEGVNAANTVRMWCRNIGEKAVYWVDVFGVVHVEDL